MNDSKYTINSLTRSINNFFLDLQTQWDNVMKKQQKFCAPLKIFAFSHKSVTFPEKTVCSHK